MTTAQPCTVAELIQWLQLGAEPDTFSADPYQDAAIGQNRTVDRLGELARLYSKWYQTGDVPPRTQLERASLAVAIEGLRMALAVTGPMAFEPRLLAALRGQADKNRPKGQ